MLGETDKGRQPYHLPDGSVMVYNGEIHGMNLKQTFSAIYFRCWMENFNVTV